MTNGYNHFYGQGGSPKPGKNCPLFTNNSQVHESDVAKGAKEAKAKMDEENQTVSLKYDPTQLSLIGMMHPDLKVLEQKGWSMGCCLQIQEKGRDFFNNSNSF